MISSGIEMTLVNKDNFVLFEGRSEKGFSAPHLLEKFLSSFPTVIWDLSTVDPFASFSPREKKISHVNSTLLEFLSPSTDYNLLYIRASYLHSFSKWYYCATSYKVSQVSKARVCFQESWGQELTDLVC